MSNERIKSFYERYPDLFIELYFNTKLSPIQKCFIRTKGRISIWLYKLLGKYDEIWWKRWLKEKD